MSKNSLRRSLTEMFPTKFLSASDVSDGCMVTVIDVTEQEVGKDKEMKFCVHFAEFSKPLVLNKTNAQALADIAGSEYTDDWEGTQVRLVTPIVEYEGKVGPAIRISSPLHERRTVEPPLEVADEGERVPF